jgi:hypothetical protein
LVSETRKECSIKMSPAEIVDVRKKAVTGNGVRTGPAMEYWKKKA